MKLAYPAKPYIVNQVYGVYRPNIYKQFGFTRHNGVDIRLGEDKTIYAEIPCVVYRTLWQPNGGGLVLSVITDKEYEFPDGVRCHVLIDYLHLEKYIVQPSDRVLEVGTPLAIADNTGFSTGPHTHIQYRRVHRRGASLVDVDTNDANNSFDPEPYRSGEFAKDIRDKKVVLIRKAIEILQALIHLLKK